MATRQPRFITTKTRVHVVGAGVECPVVKTAARKGTWKGRRGISAEAALALDPCDKCQTHERARAILGHDRDAAADQAAATRDKIAGKKRKSDLASGRRGRKSTGGGSKRKVSKAERGSKAQALKDYAEEHDWSVTIEELDGTEIKLEAIKGDLTIECYFIDGNYNRDRFSYVIKGSWKGRLRGVHGCRKQMAGENPPHPEPGKGKSARSPKARTSLDTESDVDDDDDDDDDSRGVPWLKDDEEAVIIEAVRGHVIYWRNAKWSASGKLLSAEVPPNGKRTRVYEHPRNGRRILQFDEVVYDDNRRAELGGQRDVALERIVRIA